MYRAVIDSDTSTLGEPLLRSRNGLKNAQAAIMKGGMAGVFTRLGAIGASIPLDGYGFAV